MLSQGKIAIKRDTAVAVVVVVDVISAYKSSAGKMRRYLLIEERQGEIERDGKKEKEIKTKRKRAKERKRMKKVR